MDKTVQERVLELVSIAATAADSIKKNVSGISDKEAFDIAVGLVHSSAAHANNLEAIRRAKQPVFQSDENKVGA
jgi:hypothetical protein